MLSLKNTPRLLLLITVLVTALLGMLIFIAPPALFPDPSWGFQVLRSMHMGGGFNMAISVDQDDMSKNVATYLTWWSPGQYMAPYAFIQIFGLNMGKAAALTITFFSIIGLAGFYAFFKKIGFSPLIAATSLAFVVCQQFYVLPYVFYNGGEILVFGFLGWFLYGCISFNKISWQMALFVLLSGWIGFFCKSAFIWMLAAGVLFMWINISKSEKNVRRWLINGIWLAVPFMVSIGGIIKFFMSKGTNPASAAAGIKLGWATFSFPLASPLLAGFSIDDLFDGIVYHNGVDKPQEIWSVIILLTCAGLSITLVYFIARMVPQQSYRLMLLVFYGVAVLFFSYAFLRQSAISYESRHFRVVGLLAIPGALYLVGRLRLPYQILFGLLWLYIAYTSYQFVSNGYRQNSSKNARGNSGLAQLFIDQPSLNYIMRLDAEHRNANFVFISPDLGLEILHNRIINIEPVENIGQSDPDSYVHGGHAGVVYILLPASYIGPKADLITHSFTGYPDFKPIRLSKDYVLYEGH